MSKLWKQWEGQVLTGGFRLSRLLAGYAYCAVFQAETKEGKKAAVKIVCLDPNDAAEQLARWQSAARITHPYLMRVLAADRCGQPGSGMAFLVTDFAEEDLAQILPERALSAEEAREMIEPVLAALGHLHAQGLMHGHVKPANIQVVNGELRLSIDGVCPAGKSETDAHDPGDYEAPEVSEGLVLPACDVWSVGVTLVEALTQKLPTWTAEGEPVLPDLPAPFDQVVRACLKRDPKQRATVAALQLILRPAAIQVPPPASEPTPKAASVAAQAPAAPVAPAAAKRSKLPVAIIAAVAIVIICVALLRPRSEPPQPPAQPVPTAEPPAAASKPRTKPKSEPPEPASYIPGEVLERVMPDIPAPAQRSIRGQVSIAIRVQVDPSGEVTDANYASRGPSSYFATRTLAAARRWRFSPASRNGHSVPSEWILHFEFRVGGAEVTPQRVRARQ